jgi:hypothetical protein
MSMQLNEQGYAKKTVEQVRYVSNIFLAGPCCNVLILNGSGDKFYCVERHPYNNKKLSF